MQSNQENLFETPKKCSEKADIPPAPKKVQFTFQSDSKTIEKLRKRLDFSESETKNLLRSTFDSF